MTNSPNTMRGHTKKFRLDTLYGTTDDGEFRSATIYHSGGSLHTVKCEAGEETRRRSFQSTGAGDRAKDFASGFVNGDEPLPELSETEKEKREKKKKEKEELNETLESLGFDPLD